MVPPRPHLPWWHARRESRARGAACFRGRWLIRPPGAPRTASLPAHVPCPATCCRLRFFFGCVLQACHPDPALPETLLFVHTPGGSLTSPPPSQPSQPSGAVGGQQEGPKLGGDERDEGASVARAEAALGIREGPGDGDGAGEGATAGAAGSRGGTRGGAGGGGAAAAAAHSLPRRNRLVDPRWLARMVELGYAAGEDV